MVVLVAHPKHLYIGKDPLHQIQIMVVSSAFHLYKAVKLERNNFPIGKTFAQDLGDPGLIPCSIANAQCDLEQVTEFLCCSSPVLFCNRNKSTVLPHRGVLRVTTLNLDRCSDTIVMEAMRVPLTELLLHVAGWEENL